MMKPITYIAHLYDIINDKLVRRKDEDTIPQYISGTEKEISKSNIANTFVWRKTDPLCF